MQTTVRLLPSSTYPPKRLPSYGALHVRREVESGDPLVAAAAHVALRGAAAADPRDTEKMLTQQLRELEADGIVDRRVYPTVPPKVEYSLTDYGRSLKRALRAICDWGQNHMERIGAVAVPPDRVSPSRAAGLNR